MKPRARPAVRFGLWLGLALALGAAVWSAGLDGPYLFDDFATPLGDPASQSPGDWTGRLGVTLRPATKLTYALEAGAGLVTAPHRRAGSLLLHALSGALLALLIARLEPRLPPAGAALAAALWLLHPVHAENVLLASGRSAVLGGTLLLAALLAMAARRPIAAGVLLLLAGLARETAIAGALPLLVLAASRREEPVRARLAAVVPVLAGAVASLALCLATPRYLQLAEYSYLGRPFWRSLYAQVGAVPVGLDLLARPSGLSIDYGVPLPSTASDPLFLLGLALYAAAAVGVALAFRRSPAVAVGLALWLAALLPTQSVVPKLDALTSRPLALALAGLVVAGVPAVVPHATTGAPAWRRRALGTVAVTLVAALAVATDARGALYRSELALWADAAAKSSSNARPHLRQALLLERAGREAEARAALAVAAAIDPFDSGIAALSHRSRRRMEVP